MSYVTTRATTVGCSISSSMRVYVFQNPPNGMGHAVETAIATLRSESYPLIHPFTQLAKHTSSGAVCLPWLSTQPGQTQIGVRFEHHGVECNEVVVTKDGPFALHPSDGAIVEIEYTGSYPLDYEAANTAGGFARTPKGYTWHHLDDYNPVTNRGTMQLVETPTHQANQPHVGGVSQYEAATGQPYLSWWGQ